MSAEILARACTAHPERPGAASCMGCGAVLCHECTTTWEGINYCPSCLGERAGRQHAAGHVLAWPILLVTCAALAWLAAELAATTGILMFEK